MSASLMGGPVKLPRFSPAAGILLLSLVGIERPTGARTPAPQPKHKKASARIPAARAGKEAEQ